MISAEQIKSRGLIKNDFHLPYNPKLIPRAKKLRKNMTNSEHFFWNHILTAKELSPFRFLKQRPIDNYIVDFYCAKYQLVIEIDGEIHQQQKEYDNERTMILEAYDLHVLRFTNDDVFQAPNKIKQVLIKVLEDYSNKSPASPLKGELKSIAKKQSPSYSPFSRGRRGIPLCKKQRIDCLQNQCRTKEQYQTQQSSPNTCFCTGHTLFTDSTKDNLNS
jgi:very-short-patch-repair endonuclease